MSEMKPCPFCGSRNLAESYHSPFVVCEDCGAFGPGNADSTHEEAVEAWNARALGGGKLTADVDKLLDEFEHECFMIRVEASETRARDDVVRKAYEQQREKTAQAIAATLGRIDEPDTIRNELTDGGLIADVLAPVCVDEKERRAFERGRVHERFAQQIFKEATS